MTLREGQIVRVTTPVPLEAGGKLRKGQRARVFAQEQEGWLGISWTDRDGNHSMSIRADKVEAVPREKGEPLDPGHLQALAAELAALVEEREPGCTALVAISFDDPPHSYYGFQTLGAPAPLVGLIEILRSQIRRRLPEDFQ